MRKTLRAAWLVLAAFAQAVVPALAGAPPAVSAPANLSLLGGVLFLATDPVYGRCNWNSGGDVAPCIINAMNSAAAVGGGTVLYPGGTLGLKETLLNTYSNVHLVGGGVGIPRDNTAGAFHAGTRFLWTGTPTAAITATSTGTTSLTLTTGGTIVIPSYIGVSGGQSVPAGTKIIAQVSGTPNGSGVYTTNNATTLTSATATAGPAMLDVEPAQGSASEIYNDDVTGTVFDCNSSAAVGARLSASASNIDIGHSECLTAGVYASAPNSTSSGPGLQFSHQFWIRGRVDTAGTTGVGLWIDSDVGNAYDWSENMGDIVLYEWHRSNDGIVIANSDNNVINNLSDYLDNGGGITPGNSCVFANTGYLGSNGWTANGNARYATVLHSGCGGHTFGSGPADPPLQVMGPTSSNPAISINLLLHDVTNNPNLPVYGPYATGYYSTSTNPHLSPGTDTQVLVNEGDSNVVGSNSLGVVLGEANHISGYFPFASGFGNYCTNNYCDAEGLANHATGNGSSVRGIDGSDFGMIGVRCWSHTDVNVVGDSETCDGVLISTAVGGAPARATADLNAAGTANCLNIPGLSGWGLDSVSLESVDHTNPNQRFHATWNQAHEMGKGSPGGPATMTVDGGTSTVAPDYSKKIGFSSTFTATIAADTGNGCVDAEVTPPGTDTWTSTWHFIMTNGL